MTGKLGQSLRKYNEEQGQPDFELEKFAINSLLSATHTSDMDSNDQEDIIKKVKTAGNDDSEDKDNNNDSEGEDSADASAPSGTGDNLSGDFGGDMGGSNGGASDGGSQGGEVSEGKTQVEIDNPELYPDGWKEMDGIFINPKKNNMFQPGSNDILNVNENLIESKKSSIFDKSKIKLKLQETFNQEENMSEPMIEPMVKPAPTKPATKPNPSTAPSRKNKPFLPMPNIQPDPKAIK